jgi:hypothetical protein
MSFKLTLDGANVDLFPDFVVEYGIDVYSALTPDEVKSPISFSNRFPYNTNNASVVNYDFDADKSNYPFIGKVYELTDSAGNVISAGVAYLNLVVVNSDVPYIELRFEDKATQLIKEFQDMKWSDVYKDTFSTQNNTLDSYLAANEQYNERDIELAYVDVCNDYEKFRYEARQFTAWGLTTSKVGLMPALNVNNFLNRMFTAATEVVSSAFLSNVGTWKTRNLYALVPARLMRNRVGERSQTITPYPYNIFINQNLVDGIPSDYSYALYLNIPQGIYVEMPGTNYDTSNQSGTLSYGGFYKSTLNPQTVQDPPTAGERLGYVAWSSAFDGKISLVNNGASVTFKLAIPAFTFPSPVSGVDWALLVDGINDVTQATFTPKAIVYRSGVPIAELPFVDSSGDIINLNPAGFENGQTIDQEHPGMGHLHQNAIIFEATSLFLDYPIEVLAASQYSIGIKIDIEGILDVVAVDDKDNVVAPNYQLFAQNIAKARVYNYTPSDLRVSISTNGDVVAATPNDTFNFQYTLQNGSVKRPYDLFSELVNRFGLSVIYDYSTSSFILDTLNDMRASSLGVQIDNNIDSLLPYEISGGQEKYGNFQLLNKINDGIFDKRPDGLAYGSFSGQVATGGQGEYKIQFEGALIEKDKKTVCGPVAPLPDQAIQKLLPSQEIGILSNEILDYQQIGIRLFYLRQHQYRTTVRYPQYLDTNSYGQVVQSLAYKSIGPYFLGGYPINKNESNLNLEFGNETSLDSFFTYYTNLDKILAPARTKMKFNAAVPVSLITNLSFFRDYFYFASPNENFVIDSVQGQLFDNYFYGEFTVRFL